MTEYIIYGLIVMIFGFAVGLLLGNQAGLKFHEPTIKYWKDEARYWQEKKGSIYPYPKEINKTKQLFADWEEIKRTEADWDAIWEANKKSQTEILELHKLYKESPNE